MYVEDLFLAIWARGRFVGWFPPPEFDNLLDDDWHRKFIVSVSEHLNAGKRLSTRQSHAILRLIARVRVPLVRLGMATDDDIDRMLAQPEHRQALYESLHVPREVRYLGDNRIGFRFKQNDQIILRLKATGVPATHDVDRVSQYNFSLLAKPSFDWQHKLWIVPVHRHCLKAIIGIIWEFGFAADDAVLDYLHLAQCSLDRPAAVGLIDEVILVNVCDDPLLAGWITEIAGGVTL